MDALYKKVNKSKDIPRGMVEIKEGENPFRTPCLLCLSAQTGPNNSVFGAPKVGAAMARCRTRGHYNGGFDIDSMPISFLASRVSERGESAAEYVDAYFIPLLIENGQKVDVVEACRRMRNVNILTYCDGILKPLAMEKVLIDRLTKLGYGTEEINMILGSIFVLAIATNQQVSSSKMNIALFRDVLDDEVSSQLDRAFVESQDQEMVLDVSPNCHCYYYKGDGEHDFKKYAFKGKVRAFVSLVLTSVLENSLKNANGEYERIDLTTSFNLIKDLIRRGLDEDSILAMIDSRVTYGGAPKMTEEVAKMRDQLDEICVVADKAAEQVGWLDKTCKTQGNQILAMQKAIREYCSETTALRILMETVGWQVSKDQLERIMDSPTDREVMESIAAERKQKK